MNYKAEYDILVKKYNTLLNENEKLKSILQQHGIAYSTEKVNNTETAFSSITFPPVNLSLDDKITLFRSFFKGREDVFARRWFSKTTEKGGYQPVCINEWRRGVCDKKRYKCAECPNRYFAPLTNQDVYRHLEGKDVYMSLLWMIKVTSCVLILTTRTVLTDIRMTYWLSFLSARIGESHIV